MGDSQVIHDIDDVARLVIVTKVGHRRDVYRDPGTMRGSTESGDGEAVASCPDRWCPRRLRSGAARACTAGARRRYGHCHRHGHTTSCDGNSHGTPADADIAPRLGHTKPSHAAPFTHAILTFPHRHAVAAPCSQPHPQRHAEQRGTKCGWLPKVPVRRGLYRPAGVRQRDRGGHLCHRKRLFHQL